MNKRRQKGHVVDLLFTLALFCVFTTSALVVVVIGAKVYQSTTSSMEQNYSERTALTYLAEKIRQNDTSQNIGIGEFQGAPALLIKQQSGENSYTTYLYEYQNELKELYCKDGSEVSLGDGETIMDLYDFSVTAVNGQLYRIETTAADGQVHSSLVSTRSF